MRNLFFFSTVHPRVRISEYSSNILITTSLLLGLLSRARLMASGAGVASAPGMVGRNRIRSARVAHQAVSAPLQRVWYRHWCRCWCWRRCWTPATTLGWSFCSCLCPACGEADCKCGEKWRPGIVLDPFVGIGTTLIVAKKLGLWYHGIDLKEEYCEMSRKRLKDVKYQEVFAL